MVVFVVIMAMVVVASGVAAYFMPGPEDSAPQAIQYFRTKARELSELERRVGELEHRVERRVGELERRIKELHYL